MQRGVERGVVYMVATTAVRKSLFQAELFDQWRAALAAQREAEAAGDGWLAELMSGRLEDLRGLVRHHGMLDPAMVPT
jgi:hypothetical protein